VTESSTTEYVPPASADSGDAVKYPRSLLALVALTLLDLFLVLLIALVAVLIQAAATSPSTAWGTLKPLHAAHVPLDKLGLQDRLDRTLTWSHTLSAHCVSVPVDDAELTAWLRKHPDLEPFTIRHEKLKDVTPRGETERVLVSYQGTGDAPRLDIPWQELGYRLGNPPQTWYFRNSPDPCYTPAGPQLVLILFACLMVGMFVVGIVRMWQNRPLDTVPAGNDASGLLIGIAWGLALSVVYWLTHQALLRWGGPTVALAPCWSALPISGVDMQRSGLPVFWRAVEPHPFLLAIIGVVCILYPLAVTVFLWGVFRRWTHAGWARTGCVLAQPA
jgi:hypothetical protein